ncbi:MAG: hypothetical protein AB7O37_08070 [Vicinamibacteria bacterium]
MLQAWLDEGLGRASCVAALDRDHPSFDIPTTGALVGDDLYYVASSQLRRFSADGRILPWEKLAQSTVLRTPLLPSCPSPSASPAERARAELLAAHRTDRWAHFQRDVDLLLEAQAPAFVSASRGELFRASLSDTRSRFERVFSSVRYLEWDDLESPMLTVSADGTVGTTLIRIRVRRVLNPGTPEAEETAFEYAGAMTYERRDGRFVRTQNASTFREP